MMPSDWSEDGNVQMQIFGTTCPPENENDTLYFGDYIGLALKHVIVLRTASVILGALSN